MDIREQTICLIMRAVLYSSQVLSHVRDPYLQRSLQDAIEACLKIGMDSASEPSRMQVPVAELHRRLEDISLTSIVPLRSLLLAERHVLLLLVHVRSFPDIKKQSVPGTSRDDRISEVIDTSMTDSNGLLDQRLTETMKQVLTGIQTKQPARAKDIIQHCQPLSERTIRRNLKELVTSGLVIKEMHGGTILYKTSQ